LTRRGSPPLPLPPLCGVRGGCAARYGVSGGGHISRYIPNYIEKCRKL